MGETDDNWHVFKQILSETIDNTNRGSEIQEKRIIQHVLNTFRRYYGYAEWLFLCIIEAKKQILLTDQFKTS